MPAQAYDHAQLLEASAQLFGQRTRHALAGALVGAPATLTIDDARARLAAYLGRSVASLTPPTAPPPDPASSPRAPVVVPYPDSPAGAEGYVLAWAGPKDDSAAWRPPRASFRGAWSPSTAYRAFDESTAPAAIGGFAVGQRIVRTASGTSRGTFDPTEAGAWAASPGSGGGGGLAATAVKTADYAAAPGDLVPVDAAGAPRTVTLPASPADRAQVAVKVIAAGNPVSVVAPTGASFNVGGATTLTLTLLNQAIVLLYRAAGATWYVVSTDVPISRLDERFLPVDPKAMTINSRDAAGNPTSVTEGGVTTTYTWNADGTPATETRNGLTRTYTYADGLLTGATVA